jgi:hypothetical protein
LLKPYLRDLKKLNYSYYYSQWYPTHGVPNALIGDQHEPETEDYRDIVLKENLKDCKLPPNWNKDE